MLPNQFTRDELLGAISEAEEALDSADTIPDPAATINEVEGGTVIERARGCAEIQFDGRRARDMPSVRVVWQGAASGQLLIRSSLASLLRADEDWIEEPSPRSRHIVKARRGVVSGELSPATGRLLVTAPTRARMEDVHTYEIPAQPPR